MKFRRTTALFLVVGMMLSVLTVPVFPTASDVVFSLSCSVDEEDSLTLGDTVTYTVGITENSGFSVGTLYFKPSDGLSYVSSTLLGEPADAVQAVTGENIGAWGIPYLETSDYDDVSGTFCTMTFRVDGTEDVSVRFYAYQLRSASDLPNELTTSVLPSDTVSGQVRPPAAPTVTTSSLPDAVMGQPYSFTLQADRSDYLSWELTSGVLPEGLELLNDGSLSGTPTQSGSFSIGVTASILGSVYSEEASLTLTVLEKPKKLELTEQSGYLISEEGRLTGLTDETSYSSFIANFKNTGSVKVYDLSGSEVTEPTALIGTGFTVRLTDGASVYDSADVVLLGDLNGDGRLTSVDYLRLRAYFNGDYELEGVTYAAARISGAESLTSVDYLRLRAHFNGDYNIYQN